MTNTDIILTSMKNGSTIKAQKMDLNSFSFKFFKKLIFATSGLLKFSED